MSRNRPQSTIDVNHSSNTQQELGLALGFGAMLALMGFITLVGFLGMEKIQNHAEDIVKDHMEKMHLVSQMLSSARERTVILQRMILLEDPFLRTFFQIPVDL